MKLMTIDVEDYYSLVARDKLGLEIPVSEYVDDELRRLLDLMAALEIIATCFVVGRLAKERPHLVHEIKRHGHEIASHGFEHRRMEELSPATFSKDLQLSIDILQDITGCPVHGYRAPAFSLDVGHEWAFGILAEKGIRFDSSVRIVLPFGRRKGDSLCKRAEADGIVEYPSFAIGGGPFKVPISGGGGLRLLPASILARGEALVKDSGYSFRPTYVHPYDLNASRYGEGWPSAGWIQQKRLVWFNFVQSLGRSRVAARLCGISRRNAGADEDRGGVQSAVSGPA